MKWKDVQKVYAHYDRVRKPFAWIFYIDSNFMSALKKKLSRVNQESLLDFNAKFQLIQMVFKLVEEKEQDPLTHRLAYKLAAQCVQDNQRRSVVTLFYFLHQNALFNRLIASRINSHPHRDYFSSGVLAWKGKISNKRISQAERNNLLKKITFITHDKYHFIKLLKAGVLQSRNLTENKGAILKSISVAAAKRPVVFSDFLDLQLHLKDIRLAEIIHQLGVVLQNQYALLSCLGHLQMEVGDKKSAEATYRLARETKEPGAVYQLARLYQQEKKESKAVELYEQAISDHDLQAMLSMKLWATSNQWAALSLALLFHGKTRGLSDELLDIERAIHYYKLASKLGSASADFALAQFYAEQHEEKPHIADSSQELSYLSYLNAMVKGHAKAEQKMRLLTDQNDRVAQHMMGLFYEKKNQINIAITWSIQSAEQGYEPAVDWFRITRFSPEVYAEIATLYEDNRYVSRDKEKAMHFYKKAAEHNHLPTLIKLANCCLVARDEKGNVAQAFAYYLQAARHGLEQAHPILRRIARDGSPLMRTQLADFFRTAGLGYHDDYKALDIKVEQDCDLKL